MELLKLLNAYEVLAQILSFLLLFMLLRTFFWRKFIKFLDGRKEKIASEFRAIEEQKAQIDTMRRQYMQKLQSEEDTVKIKIREAIDEGYKIRDELKKKAESE